MDYKKLLSCMLIGFMYTPVTSAQSLEQAVEQSLRLNPTISIHLNRYRAAIAAKDEAQSGYWPTLDLNGGYGRERTDSPASRGIFNNDPVELNRGVASISLKQMLFDGFDVSYQVEERDKERLKEQHKLFLQVEELALKVSSIYLDTLKNQQIVVLSQDNIVQHQKIYDKIALRVRQGVGSQADLSQIRSRISRAQVSLVSAQHNLANAQARYLSAVSSSADKLVVPKSDQTKIAKDITKLTASTLEFHPKLLAARFEIAAKKHRLNGSSSNYYPKLTLELSANYNNDIDGLAGYNNDATAMLNLKYNLFRGGRDAAKNRRSAYQWNEAKDAYNNEVRQLAEKGQLALNSLMSLSSQLDFLAKHVQASEVAHLAYQKQFEINKRTLLDLLDSSNELFQARKSFIETEFNQLYSQYRVLENMGILLDSLQVNRPVL